MSDASKKEALEAALKQIEKDLGKGTIMRWDEDSKMNVEVIPTGIISLDKALGVGGLPKGRIIEIYGPEASGKTSLALNMVAQVQAMGGTVAYIDNEQALDPVWAAKLGVNMKELIISQPSIAEEVLTIVDKFVRSGALDLIVVDSVAAMTTRAELEGEMGESIVGLKARLMSQSLSKLAGVVSNTKTMLIFINQLRDKINTYGWGPKETTTGGQALKFYASVRLDVRKIGAIKDGENIIGNNTKVKVAKNKVAPPFKEAEFNIYYDTGIDKIGAIFDTCVTLGLIDKDKSTYSYKGVELGVGRNGGLEGLKANPEILKQLTESLKGK
jgi:recombination protein RecA